MSSASTCGGSACSLGGEGGGRRWTRRVCGLVRYMFAFGVSLDGRRNRAGAGTGGEAGVQPSCGSPIFSWCTRYHSWWVFHEGKSTPRPRVIPHFCAFLCVFLFLGHVRSLQETVKQSAGRGYYSGKYGAQLLLAGNAAQLVA